MLGFRIGSVGSSSSSSALQLLMSLASPPITVRASARHFRLPIFYHLVFSRTLNVRGAGHSTLSHIPLILSKHILFPKQLFQSLAVPMSSLQDASVLTRTVYGKSNIAIPYLLSVIEHPCLAYISSYRMDYGPVYYDAAYQFGFNHILNGVLLMMESYHMYDL